MKLYDCTRVIAPLVVLAAAACSSATDTHASGSSTGGSAEPSGASSTGLGSTGSGMAVGSGATSGAAENAASGTMNADAASSGNGATQEAGEVRDTGGGDATDATTTIAQGPCTGNTLKPGDSTLMMESGGQMRSYIMHVPPKYDGTTRLPLVIDMHGKGDTAAHEMSWSGWLAKADAVGIVMIYPQGLYNSWNAGPPNCPILMCCCEPAQDYNIDDASFIRAVVTKTEQDGCIDRMRVYATGLSNGGIMSAWLACDAADVFAAVAPVSGPNMIDCMPSRPVSVVLYRGLMDTGVLYNGGNPSPTGHVWPSAMADFTKWSGLDGCTDAPVALPLYSACQFRSKCSGGSEVILCSPNAPHNLYGAAMSQMVAVADVAWEIFQSHTLP